MSTTRSPKLWGRQQDPATDQNVVPAKTPNCYGKNDAGDPKVVALIGDTPGSTGCNDEGSSEPVIVAGTKSGNAEGLKASGLSLSEKEQKMVNVENKVDLLIKAGRAAANDQSEKLLKSLRSLGLMENNMKPGEAWNAAADNLEYWWKGGHRRSKRGVGWGKSRPDNYTMPAKSFWPDYAEFLLNTIANKCRRPLLEKFMSNFRSSKLKSPYWICDGHVDRKMAFNKMAGIGGLYYAVNACNVVVTVRMAAVGRTLYGKKHTGSSLQTLPPTWMNEHDELHVGFTSLSFYFYDKYDWHKGLAVKILGGEQKDDDFADVEPEVGRPYDLASEAVTVVGMNPTAAGSYPVANHRMFKPAIITSTGNGMKNTVMTNIDV